MCLILVPESSWTHHIDEKFYMDRPTLFSIVIQLKYGKKTEVAFLFLLLFVFYFVFSVMIVAVIKISLLKGKRGYENKE